MFPYYLVLKSRDSLYRKGKKTSATASVPTICVGGITVGGTGKTPFTEMVVEMLGKSPKWKDRRLAVLSRGYRRKTAGFRLVLPDGTAAEYGDEPLQIKRKFPEMTVAVCRNRAEGAEILASREGAELIVLDDAYQARELKAGLNIVLVDYNRPVFKDRLLPMGELRDLPERLYDADVVVVTKCPVDLQDSERESFALGLGYGDYSMPSCLVTAKGGKRQLLLFATTEYLPFKTLNDKTDPRFMYSKRLIMFSGIAKDSQLYEYLSGSYKIIRRFVFPDHHRYSWADLDKVSRSLLENPTACAVTTEKDAQRLPESALTEEPLLSRLFVAPIKMRFLDSAEEVLFAQVLEGLG